MTTAPTHRRITIYWDDQDQRSVGWAYRIDGGSSGPIDCEMAIEAIRGIIDGTEASGPDLAALRVEIEHQAGDLVEIAGPGLPGSLGDLLDRGV